MGIYTIRPLTAWTGPATPPGRRIRAPFKASVSDTRSLLARELRMLNATSVVVQVRCDEGQIRNDGELYANARLSDPSTRLLFDSRHGPLAYGCDRFDRFEDNLRAIALGLEALRRVDRYRIVTEAGEGAQYKGYRQITDGHAVPARTGSDTVLMSLVRLAEGPDLDAGTLERMARDLAGDRPAQRRVHRRAQRRTHPDHNGGRAHDWDEVQRIAGVLGLR